MPVSRMSGSVSVSLLLGVAGTDETHCLRAGVYAGRFTPRSCGVHWEFWTLQASSNLAVDVAVRRPVDAVSCTRAGRSAPRRTNDWNELGTKMNADICSLVCMSGLSDHPRITREAIHDGTAIRSKPRQ